MRNTNLLALSAALILACVWAWASSTSDRRSWTAEAFIMFLPIKT